MDCLLLVRESDQLETGCGWLIAIDYFSLLLVRESDQLETLQGEMI